MDIFLLLTYIAHKIKIWDVVNMTALIIVMDGSNKTNFIFLNMLRFLD